MKIFWELYSVHLKDILLQFHKLCYIKRKRKRNRKEVLKLKKVKRMQL